MNIQPPKIAIDPQDPFKDALFSRKAFALSLTQLLRNVSESLVIFVHAPWGEGKTTFAQMWRAELARQKLGVVYFDAYATDYLEDPFIAFSAEILALCDEKFTEGEGLIARQKFKKSAIEVGKRLAGLTARLAIKSATLGLIEEAHIRELKDIGSEVASDVAKIASEAVEEKIAHYAQEKQSLAAFKTNLAKLAAAFRKEQDFPLTILVDELDRCRPSFALGLLERIKHLFDVEDVAFVLLVNQEQIESYINKVYGEVDARGYLLKFGNLFAELPCRTSEDSLVHESGRRHYCGTLATHHGLNKQRESVLQTSSVALFAEHLDLSLREIEKAFIILTLFCSTQDRGAEQSFLAAILSVIKVKKPQLYAQLRAGSASLKVFSTDIRLEQLKPWSPNPDLDWLKKLLAFCLMSADDYQNARHEKLQPFQVVMSDFESRFRMERNTIIPTLCSRLDRFSLNPV